MKTRIVMQKESWQKILAHYRAIRDGYVACGNPAPTKPDPDGGLVNVKLVKFNGAVFYPFIEKLGHTKTPYEECKCSRQS